MENTTYENAVNEELREIHRMVETVKQDPEVGGMHIQIVDEVIRLSEENARITEENVKITEENTKLAEKNAKVTEENMQLIEVIMRLRETLDQKNDEERQPETDKAVRR